MKTAVVICFHFTIFVVLETTPPRWRVRVSRLWFAFILLSLSYWKQRQKETGGRPVCCDLLSFYYLCRTGNNPQLFPPTHRTVVICFHFTIFVVLETTKGWTGLAVLGCDLLSFYYLCRTGNNNHPARLSALLVVICFHFTIFVVLETTRVVQDHGRILLWFAFILLSLSYWKQLGSARLVYDAVVICFHFTIFVVLETTYGVNTAITLRCDLLSFYYLCRTGNNNWPKPPLRTSVVICFHFTIFVVLETTLQRKKPAKAWLWFAFILLSLSYWKQLLRCAPPASPRCDLLSFYYLCRTGNNDATEGSSVIPVVICFHFTIFVVLETTTELKVSLELMLWFAFILLSLSYWKQLAYLARDAQCVVICFHFTIFVVLETTNSRVHSYIYELWFAFILLSLSYWKQPADGVPRLRARCDLLSFYYLCRTGNNACIRTSTIRPVVICFHFTIFVVLETTRIQQADHQLLVVICFHFTIFVVLETTPSSAASSGGTLWFAFILLSLSYWKQRWGRLLWDDAGCDLLSFYYLCRTGNNSCGAGKWYKPVVICFHFTIFVVLETT